MQNQKVKTLTGVVISSSGDKSVRLKVDYKVKHPKYGKYIKRTIKIGVHDEHNKCGIGDLVEVAPCRPHSKTKNYRLVNVIQKAIEE